MSLEFTKKIELGYRAPYFKLLEPLTGKLISITDLLSDKATVVVFLCNHCPYVKHINKGIVELANKYIPKGISFVAINPNDANKYPEDSPVNMIKIAEQLNYPFPYLYDESQEVAKSYHASCTPDFSIFDGDDQCVYRGQFDGARPGNDVPVTGIDIATVLDAILSGNTINPIQTPSAGCSIKWSDSLDVI